MTGFAGKTVSYRLYCGCGAETVVRQCDLETAPWAVDSLHAHRGTCPDCRAGVDASEAEPAAGQNHRLTAFAADGGEPE